MHPEKDLKYLIVKHGYLIKDVAVHLGMSYNNFNNKLSRGTINYNDVKKALDYIGYDIVWKKKDK